MDQFEEFVREHPASLIAILIAAIFLCVVIAFTIKTAVTCLAIMLLLVLIFYSISKFGMS